MFVVVPAAVSVAVGDGLTVTVTEVDVDEQPLLFDTCTLYVPDVVAE